jgi:two-component system, sensor histidine kinase and response regulator
MHRIRTRQWEASLVHDSASDDNSPQFLSTQDAGRGARRRAMAVALLSAVVFAALVPFAKLQLAPLAAFIPLYESALVVSDLITAVLLFGQFRITRSPALCLLACGYLFTALIAVAHALSFPGLFAPGGLLGAGPQSTAWLYMLWHAGFPLFVIAYARLRQAPLTQRSGAWFAGSLPAVLLGVVACVALVTAGQAALPAIMQGNRYTPVMVVAVGSVWAASALALLVLWRRRPHSVLDLWLMVVMCAWLADIALSAVLNAGRFDLGFYAGRIYGLLASGFVLLELLLENGSLYARLVSLHADEHRRAEELRAARDAAQSASAAKGLFLANMSHEIRTPMNAIIGLAHLVLDTPLNEQQRDYLQKMQASSKALMGLLNDILDFSKIEAGRLTLEQEEFNPEEVIENVGQLFSAKAEEAGLDLFFEIEPELPRRLIGDALRLTQVLNNLVSNAIKFTRRGEVLIAVETLQRDAGAVMLRFEVRDTGIGLTTEQIERLFEAFIQADTSTTRRFGGTGLGLAICKRLVELMGGGISVRSEPGEGSSFSFSARFRLAAPPAAREDLQHIEGMRVLVVDGQPTSREILQQVLQSWRLQVSASASTHDALAKLREAREGAPYELLLLDWKTPGLADQFELAHDLVQPRNAAQAASPPIIVLASAHAKERLQARGGHASPSAVLVKPITPSRLFDVLVRLQHGERDAASPAAGTAKAASFAAARSIHGAHILLVEDNLINQEVASEFLTRAGLQLTVASNGLEAVDWIKRRAFDGVLMDMQMPVMDGIQATRLIRTLPQGGSVPIIAMTAAAMQQDKLDCLAAGMDAHISKPIDPQELVSTLLAWVRPGRHAQATAVPDAADDAALLRRALPGVAVDAALQRMAGNTDLYHRLLLVYLQQYRDAGMRLQQMYVAGDLKGLDQLAHGLTSEAGMLGLMSVSQSAQRLCRMLKEPQSGSAVPTQVSALIEACNSSVELLARMAPQVPS